MASLGERLAKVVQLGVDPALPRRDTKHIALTNAYGLYLTFIFGTSAALGGLNSLRTDVRVALALGGLLTPVALALNHARRPILAASWLLAMMFGVFGFAGLHEPGLTEHEAVLMSIAVVAFFLYPSSRRGLATPWLVLTLVAVVGLRVWLRDHEPPQLPTFDAFGIGTGNLLITAATFAWFSNRSVSEIDRVERELVEERKKTEALLKREVAHQVAERSRELGSALAGAATLGSTPTRFGDRYKVLRPLGQGGMGAVHEVERTSDGARLALKVMTGEVSREQAVRFAREAEIGARLHHEHLVGIVDVGMAEGGAPYLVMELMPGGSLEGQRARFGEVPWALAMLRQMAAGLVALHEAGVVHRDLKPANVLLDAGGTAKLSDFGIARMGAIPMGAVDPDAPTAQPAQGPARGSALTATGAWVGTPLYMPPEAARGGREVLPSADVFSFALVAHELLTGSLPFGTPPVLLALVQQPLPAVPPIAAPLPGELATLLAASMSADPAARPTAQALLAALGG